MEKTSAPYTESVPAAGLALADATGSCGTAVCVAEAELDAVAVADEEDEAVAVADAVAVAEAVADAVASEHTPALLGRSQGRSRQCSC